MDRSETTVHFGPSWPVCSKPRQGPDRQTGRQSRWQSSEEASETAQCNCWASLKRRWGLDTGRHYHCRRPSSFPLLSPRMSLQSRMATQMIRLPENFCLSVWSIGSPRKKRTKKKKKEEKRRARRDSWGRALWESWVLLASRRCSADE